MTSSGTSSRRLPAILAQSFAVAALLAPAASAAAPIHPLVVRFAHPIVKQAVLAPDPPRAQGAEEGGEPDA